MDWKQYYILLCVYDILKVLFRISEWEENIQKLILHNKTH